jgi:hypothetical protein
MMEWVLETKGNGQVEPTLGPVGSNNPRPLNRAYTRTVARIWEERSNRKAGIAKGEPSSWPVYALMGVGLCLVAWKRWKV